jgi:hypothetical protein
MGAVLGVGISHLQIQPTKILKKILEQIFIEEMGLGKSIVASNRKRELVLQCDIAIASSR